MPAKGTLLGHVLDKLREHLADGFVLKLLSLGGVVSSFVLGGLARGLSGLTEIQRGMLWGAAELALLASVALAVFGLVLYLPRRAEETEINDLVSGVRNLVRETGWIYGGIIPRGTSPGVIAAHISDISGALLRLHLSLVQAKKFRQRLQLFWAIRRLEEKLFEEGEPEWHDIEPYVRHLEHWADFAEKTRLLRSLPPNNPLDRRLP
jgi:hypothetical protein